MDTWNDKEELFLEKFSEKKLVITESIILGRIYFVYIKWNYFALCGCNFVCSCNGLIWPSGISILSKPAGNIHQGPVQDN